MRRQSHDVGTQHTTSEIDDRDIHGWKLTNCPNEIVSVKIDIYVDGGREAKAKIWMRAVVVNSLIATNGRCTLSLTLRIRKE